MLAHRRTNVDQIILREKTHEVIPDYRGRNFLAALRVLKKLAAMRITRIFQVPSKPNTYDQTFAWISFRSISIHQLNMLPCLHLEPIYLVVSKGPSYVGYLILRGASRLDAFSVYPCRTWLLCHGSGIQQIHQWFVHPGPLVLRTAPLKYPTPTPDRDRTVSRRSEPSSRTALMGEQPNPWDLLQPQDAMSRHRGAKPLRRCELLGVISLLSPG